MGTSRKGSENMKHPSGSKPATSPLPSTEQHTSISGKHRSHVSTIYQNPGARSPPVTSSSRPRQSTDESRQSHSPPPSLSPPGTSDRKSKLRLRNREAAQKCRKRKQRSIAQLQNQEVAVEAMHDALMTEAAQLQQEVLVLKNMVLDHGRCNCDFIEDYIQGAASNLTQHGGGCDGISYADTFDGAVKIEEDGASGETFPDVVGYHQGEVRGNQLNLQQSEEIGNPGLAGMDMAMSSFAPQGQPVRNLGIGLCL